MCMIDYYSDGTVRTLKTVKVKARKPHPCSECRRFIQTGETYLYESCVFEGLFLVYKTCEHCQAVRDWLYKECGGFLYEGVFEDFWQHADEEGEYYGWDVKRAAIAMKNKWARRDGSLRPLPVL
jgi:hypothetical protein